MNVPPSASSTEDLAGALERLIAWLRQSRESSELSVSSISALSRLEDAGPLRITELARRESLSQPGVTTLINRLEDGGLVERIPDSLDGRAVLVSVTPDGVERLRAHRSARTELIARQIGTLDPDDRRALLEATGALNRFVQTPAAANLSSRHARE